MNYYQRKISFLNTYEKIKAISQKDNNYSRFFVSHLKAQVTMIKDQLNTSSNTFRLIIYFNNSLRSNEEKAYLAQQLGTWGKSFPSSPMYYNYPTNYFFPINGLTSPQANESVGNILGDMDRQANLSPPIYNNHVILIFTIDASETNRFIQQLATKTKHQSKMPFIIIGSLSPQITLEDFYSFSLKYI
ncbi:hypothetical protein A8135_03955 [Legionella jamestowniensis]|uniref:Uncharacterized protein n=1 Tax=Legionella jamestowniensis TaxID=455 RepID=A0ABX2XQB6_9GAMM|nr:hypothetical protein [Legionella jamestowniensis]OCH96803.1 hypothetical protein A8135_03955 [Legionella jamestowniensis]